MASNNNRLTPRQKMINLMYIVLTAMLALNVSSDVLNGFKQVEDGLERSTSNASLQNDVLYQKLADFNSQNPEKGGPWYKKSLEVKKQTALLYDYIDSLKNVIVKKADGPIFNNAAQAWNHTFFFLMLTPDQKPMPQKLADRIARDFGSVEAFKEEFSKAATGLFGSGWTWLAADKDGKLQIISESNAGNPMTKGLKPVMTIDVWEHAYYIDYRNRRADAVAALWDRIDWKVVEERYAKE